MALVMPQLGFALLAVLGLQEFIDSPREKKSLQKSEKHFLSSGGLIALSILIFFMSDFKSMRRTILNSTFDLIQQMARGKQPTPEIEQQASNSE